MKIEVHTYGLGGPPRVRANCPHCGQKAVLEKLEKEDISVNNEFFCGQRKCPDPDCNGHIFTVVKNNELIASYPPIRIDFDSKDIPDNILKTFEEAIDCHANRFYVASAIMIRRTLEEICEEKKATDGNLKSRLKDLAKKIVLPRELIDAMDELRLLGNDAAHIKSQDFKNISKNEVEIAIDLTKEILKGLYQLESLVDRLRDLKDKDTSA